MLNRIFAIIVILIAVFIGILANFLANQPNGLQHLVLIHRIFDMGLPVLGAGALIKFLFWHHKSHCKQGKE